MNETNRQTIGKLFKVIGDSLLSMDDHEFDLMIQGKGILRFAPVSEPAKKRSVESQVRHDAVGVAKKLHDAETREDANIVIASIKHRPKKEFLSQVARAAGVHVESRDSIAKIELKLIEATVGAKLRSRAFQEVPFGPATKVRQLGNNS